MFAPAAALVLDSAQKQILETVARAGSTPQAVARKCRVILLAAEGDSNNLIAYKTGLSRPTVIAIRAAFAHGGIEAIRRKQTRKRTRRVRTPELEKRILDTTLQTRPPDATH
jgi:transposase